MIAGVTKTDIMGFYWYLDIPDDHVLGNDSEAEDEEEDRKPDKRISSKWSHALENNLKIFAKIDKVQ